MTQPAADYGMRSIETMLRMSRAAIARLVKAGFVTPARGPRNEYRFSFQDVVLLRTAAQLRSAHIPARRLLRSLQQLRAELPEDLPLTGLRIRAVGDTVAVRDRDTQWDPRTGQLLMDLEVSDSNGSIRFLEAESGSSAPLRMADDWFREGELLEQTDPQGAAVAYENALQLAPDLVRAYLNLGALLCEAGRCQDALALYERAVEQAPEDPQIHFNGAVALEDLGMHRDAIRSYERCLALAPYLADAHYNAARLYEKLGDAQATLRHFNAYRRLQRQEST